MRTKEEIISEFSKTQPVNDKNKDAEFWEKLNSYKRERLFIEVLLDLRNTLKEYGALSEAKKDANL